MNDTKFAPVIEPALPASKPAQPEFSFHRWLNQTLIVTLIGAMAFVALNVKLDVLGLFGNRDVRVLTLPRFSVYLLTYKFIPENFDGLIIGNSGGSTYDTTRIHSYKVFNAALRASSLTEERLLTEQVLRRGHLKAVVLILNPDLTATHNARSTYMTSHDYYSSFGSVQTLILDLQLLRQRLGHPGPITYSSYGQTIWPLKMLPERFKPFRPEDLVPDPVEMKDMNDLLSDLHAKNVRVFILFAPMYQPKWDGQREQLLKWQSEVSAGFTKQDTVIHIPPDIERPLQGERTNFPDYAHMSASASNTVTDVIGQYLAAK